MRVSESLKFSVTFYEVSSQVRVFELAMRLIFIRLQKHNI